MAAVDEAADSLQNLSLDLVKKMELKSSMATFSSMLKNMIEDVSDPSSVVPLPNVTAEILDMVIEYCQRHAESKDSNNNKDEELKAFDAEFVNVDQETLFGLILAANYLNIKGLLDLTCQAVAEMIKDKSPEEVREFFNIENDYTPEEEEHVRKECAWAFE